MFVSLFPQNKNFYKLLWGLCKSQPRVRYLSMIPKKLLGGSWCWLVADLVCMRWEVTLIPLDVPFKFESSLLIHYHRHCVCKHKRQKCSNDLSYSHVDFLPLPPSLSSSSFLFILLDVANHQIWCKTSNKRIGILLCLVSEVWWCTGATTCQGGGFPCCSSSLLGFT